MVDWFSAGCAACRQRALTGQRRALRELADCEGWAVLLQCLESGRYSEENTREMHVIDEATAMQTFPEVFRRV